MNNYRINCPKGTMPYTIRSGDTLYSVAMTFGISLNSLIAVNPGINPENLYIGQVICVPAACSYGTIAYVIKPGDTLYSISIKYNTSVDEIIQFNPSINPNNLMIGEVICIPLY